MSPHEEQPGRPPKIGNPPVEDPTGPADDEKRRELLIKCRDPAVRAAQQAKCVADAVADQQTFDELKAQFDDLRKAINEHNLAVSGYEGQLQVFQADLSGFQADLILYMHDLVGRTYTTTALDDEADQLDEQSAKLSARRADLNDLLNSLEDEADEESDQETDLKQDLEGLRKSIADSLKALDCITCSALTALLAQTDSLLSRVKFTIKTPSGPPPGIPFVPRLPAPPKPGVVTGPPPPQAATNPPPTSGSGAGQVVVEYFYAHTVYLLRGQEAPVTPIADPQETVSL